MASRVDVAEVRSRSGPEGKFQGESEGATGGSLQRKRPRREPRPWVSG